MARALLTNVDGFGLGGLSSNAASLFLDQAYISAVQAGELIAVTDRGGTASPFAPTATAFSADLGSLAGGGELTLPSDTGLTDALGSGVAPGFDITTPSSQAAFSSGNIVVYRVGTGSAALSSAATAVFLDEYTTSGTLVQSIALPTADNGANQTLTASGSATSEGQLSRSVDGRYLLLTGYDAAPGTTSVNGTSTATVVRVIGRVDSNGIVDTTTTTTAFSGNNVRDVASTNGTDIWAVGANTGVVYTTFGSSGAGTVVSNTATNFRTIDIFGDQLYYSANTTTFRVGTVGVGTPTVTGNLSGNLPGTPTTGSPYSIFFADLTAAVAGIDTLYVADDAAGIQKYSLVGGNWSLNGTITATTVRGLTGVVAGTNVSLYSTNGSIIGTVTDTAGYNAAPSTTTVTTIATASTNTAFRGIALAPNSGENQVASITVSPTSQNEGNSGSTAYTFTVTRTGGTTGALAFAANFGAVGTNSADFTGGTLPGTVNGTILAGQATATFTVSVAGDLTPESNENFTYSLASVSNGTAASATIGTTTATATIVDDDTPVLPENQFVSITVSPTSQNEGDAGSTAYTFTISRTGGTSGTLSFSALFVNGTTNETDFVGGALPGTVNGSIAAGQTSTTFTVNVAGDTTPESDETFSYSLGSLSNPGILVSGAGGASSATATIVNDDVAPTSGENQVASITVSPTSQNEGALNTQTPYTFTVTRTGGTSGALNFTATFNAVDTSANDFVSTTFGTNVSGTILAGQASATFTINVQGDGAVENNENFAFTLSSVSNSQAASTTIGTATATATIVNDDVAPLPSLSINDVFAVEGNSGTTTFTFTVMLNGPAPVGGVTFDIATANGTATAGSDYIARTLTTQTIPAGSTTYTFDVTVNGDTVFESNETFFVNLTNVTGATVFDGQGLGTIGNDDSAAAPVLVSSTPADNSTNVAVASNIVLTFDQDVFQGTGNIIIRPPSGADLTIPINDPQVTITGNVVTINPTIDLRPGAAHDVIIGSGVLFNSTGVPFAGIVLDALDFTTSFTIPAGTFNPSFVIQDPGTFTLLSGTTRTAAGGTGVSVGGVTGPINVTIDGTLNDTASTFRAINYTNSPANGTISVGASGVVQSFNGDTIRSQSQRGQIDLTNLGQIIARAAAFTPSVGGTNPGTAFAITYNAALGATGAPSTDFTTGGTINNGSVGNTTALIRADNGDAIRLGSRQTLNNYGTINGNGPVNDAATNNVFNGANGNPNTSVTQTYDVSRGVRVNQGAATAVAVNNFGTITGAQHGLDVGVTDATNLIFTNNAGGQIIGRNGSGIGADTTGAAATTVTVINSGLIRGDYAPAFDRAGYVTVDGDGDGVDIDGGATITNNVGGIIRSTGAGGFDSGGRANNSEAISIGGGAITNQGTIEGFNFGIVVNNDSNPNNSRSGSTATTILNYAGGTISGGTGFAIRLENKTGTAIDNDAITNYGTITGTGTVPTGTVLRQDNVADPGAVGTLDGVTYTAADAGNARFIRGDGAAIQTGEGNDTLANYGTITGNSGRAINLEGGTDQLTLRTGSSITGRIDGGAGTDTLILALDDRVAGNAQTGANSGVTTGSLTNVINFENLTVTSGTWTITDAQAYSGGIALNGGRLNLSAVVTGAVTFGAGAQTLGIANAALGADFARTLGNAITGFGADGDVLDFTSIVAGTVITNYNATTGLLKLIDRGDTAQATINVGTGLGAFAFSLADNGSGGTAVTLVANAGGNTGFAGSGGNDNYTGTPGNDFFNFSQGGNDTVSGGDGNDGFLFGAAFTAADRVDGGAGANDQIGLQGNYSGANALTLGASTIANVEVIAVLAGFSYDITTVDDNIGAGQILTFFGTNLGAGDNFTVNASAETDGAVRIYGGLGIDTFTGGAGDDGFYFGPGRFNPATDTVNGGAGTNDQVAFDGNFTGTLNGAQISNVEVLALLAGVAGDFANYSIQFADSLVGMGQNFTVFALPVVTALQLDASAETNGNYSFIAGSSADTLIGGAGNDTFFGGLGADVLTGGLGNDLFRYTSVNETLVGSGDRITDFSAGDRIELTQIDADGNAGNGDTAFTFIGAGAFTNIAGQLRVIASGGDWLIEGDVNGDGAADFQILAQGAQPLEAQFLL
ncbi:MAG: Ig-like domain-containing protein [Sphingomonas sp.]|uniref:Calx-beta domain-containing protein n=1 Tax=Sphingomonas sp. TaxID=28214 RepID=UPI0025DB22C4|nr:Calx-beta domain-containing protein [Sphingomonas sp.]MBY0284297.1 Ig-like domain-containing protein [Sphingomonas sp.]